MKINRRPPIQTPIESIVIKQSPYILGKPTDRTVTLRPYKYGVEIHHRSFTEGDYLPMIGVFKLNTRAARELAEAILIIANEMEKREN